MDPSAPAPLTQPSAPSSTSATGISLLSSLLSSISSRSTPKRALFSNLPFEIGPSLTISVRGYILHKPQAPKRSCYIYVDAPTGPQIAKGVSQILDASTSRPVEKVEIKKSFKFGGSQILFTTEEVKQLRTFTDPMIRILGFKSLEKLFFWANLKPATFIYPSEEHFVGSTRVFSALHCKLHKSKRFALAWFVPRRNAVPSLAAIYPSLERVNLETGDQTQPPGLWISPLPFADDVRLNPETQLIRAPDRLVDLMRDVVQQLQLPKAIYDPSKYPNPSLQWHYRILQALALEEDLPEKPEDKTLPKWRQIDKRAGPYVMDWGEELEARWKEWESVNGHTGGGAAVPAKRAAEPRATQDGMPDRAKKAKIGGEGDVEMDDNAMKKAFEENRVGKLTVGQLKGWLSGKKMPVSGKKMELVDRVEGWFEMK